MHGQQNVKVVAVFKVVLELNYTVIFTSLDW